MPKDNQQIIEEFNKNGGVKFFMTETQKALVRQESQLKAQWRKEIEGITKRPLTPNNRRYNQALLDILKKL